MEVFWDTPEEWRQIAVAEQKAVSILGQVVDAEVRKATSPDNWIGTEASAWTALPKRTPSSVAYHARQANPIDRQFHVEGEVRVENKGQTMTIAVHCWAHGGRRKDPVQNEVVDVPNVNVQESKSWPAADANEECIGQWIREQLRAFMRACQEAQPNKWAR